MAGKYAASSHRNCVGRLGMWRETWLHACPQQYIIFFFQLALSPFFSHSSKSSPFSVLQICPRCPCIWLINHTLYNK